MVRGLLIGRFQPFHKGHADAVEHALTQCDELTIMIGSPKNLEEINNPFTLSERKKMIQLGLEKETFKKCKLSSVDDYNDHSKWIKEIEKTRFDIVFSNNPDVQNLLKKHAVKSIPVKIKCNGSEVRRKMCLDQNWKECVHPRVAKYLVEINAVKRIKQLLK